MEPLSISMFMGKYYLSAKVQIIKCIQPTDNTGYIVHAQGNGTFMNNVKPTC